MFFEALLDAKVDKAIVERSQCPFFAEVGPEDGENLQHMQRLVGTRSLTPSVRCAAS